MLADKLSMESLLKHGDALPSLPEIYTKVSDQLDDVDASVEAIAKTISADPSISYKMLSMVNSAYFGMPNKISSINQSLSLLGRSSIKQILIGAVLGDVFDDVDSPHFSLHDFWLHSIRTAIIAKQLVVESRCGEDPESLFTAGLLHDVGRLVLVMQLPDEMAEIEQHLTDRQIDTAQTELDFIGVSHIEIGGALMQKWDFPELIWISVLNHHNPNYTGPFFNAAHIIYLASQIAHHPSPNDESEARAVLQTVPNWLESEVSAISVFNACVSSDAMQSKVMESLGISLE